MKINAAHIAKLANIPLKPSESETLASQLESTLKYIDQLNEVDTNAIEPTSQVTGLENVTREDIATESLSQDQALLNTTGKHNGLFKVKGILDNG